MQLHPAPAAMLVRDCIMVCMGRRWRSGHLGAAGVATVVRVCTFGLCLSGAGTLRPSAEREDSVVDGLQPGAPMEHPVVHASGRSPKRMRGPGVAAQC